MNKVTYILLLCSLSLGLSAQDQIWLGGINEYPGQSDYGNYKLTFDGNTGTPAFAALKMNFEGTTAVATDSDGAILFYSNGCYIATADGDTMPNSTGLNPGEMSEWTCGSAGYANPRGALVLKKPGGGSIYYLFHLGIRYEAQKKLSYGPFYYTVVDMSLNNGEGAVTEKNVIIADGFLEPFSAVHHGNGRDWWLVFSEYQTNRYHKVLFTPQGIFSSVQVAGDSLKCLHIGSSNFSPNGTRYARSQSCGVAVLDFDRCSGMFSSPVQLPLPPGAFGGGGVAFSPDGNRLLATTQLAVLQADLTLTTPELDTLVPTTNLFGISLGLMAYTPSQQILVGNMARNKYMHLITSTSDTSVFMANTVNLQRFGVRSMPNTPNFGLLDLPESVCDTLGISGTQNILSEQEFKIYPNPASGQVFITLSNMEEGVVSIHNNVGSIVLRQRINPGVTTTALDLSALPDGIYYVRFNDTSGKSASRKLVLLRER